MLDEVDYPTSMRNHLFPLYHLILPEQQQDPEILGVQQFSCCYKREGQLSILPQISHVILGKTLGVQLDVLADLAWHIATKDTFFSFPPPHPPTHCVRSSYFLMNSYISPK